MKSTNKPSSATQCVGLMMLLLTLSNPTLSSVDLDTTNNSRYAPDVFESAEYPFLAYAASILGANGNLGPIPVASSIKGAKIKSKKDEEDEDEEEKVSEEGNDSTQGKTDTEDDVVSTDGSARISTPPPDTSVLMMSSSTVLPEIMPLVMEYMPLTSMASVRRVSHAFFDASRHVIDFNSSLGAFFIPYDAQTSSIPRAPKQSPSELRRLIQWQCSLCLYWNPMGRNTCGNSSCCQLTELNSSVRRLFVGQLRKEGTAKMLHWVLGMLCPDIDVLHIEPHTNPNQGGRGKGCAWLYVRNDEDAEKILQVTRRAFVDVVQGVEGIWFSGPSEDDKDLLTYYAHHQGTTDVARPHHLMPRNPVVIEEPSKSINSSSNPNTNNNVVIPRPQPQQPKHYYDQQGATYYHAQPQMMSSMVPPPPPMPPTRSFYPQQYTQHQQYYQHHYHANGCLCMACCAPSHHQNYSTQQYYYPGTY